MINIDYSEGKIKINTGNIDMLFNNEQLPLRFDIKKSVSKEVVWSTNLNSNMWAVYGENEINDVVVYDANDNFILQYYWDVISHGSIFYKSIFLYCKSLINSGKKPNGLVIGTHDGEFGEWVPLVKNNLSNMVLIEGTEKQYNKLCKNFQDYGGLTFVNTIVSTNGKDAMFYEGGLGYTNTVVERVIRVWEKEEIKPTLRKTNSINEVIKNYFENNFINLDWLHLDVEGLDVELIVALKKEYIPNFIIFEDFNLTIEDKIKIDNWIIENKFRKHSENGICLITK
jgi:hypothetical protein